MEKKWDRYPVGMEHTKFLPFLLREELPKNEYIDEKSSLCYSVI